jgi:endonuclease/exonuclease/phosphatase family metal-dependent hydrolase
MEEYVVLWKSQANRLQLNANASPAPASLIGVVDDNALSQLFSAKGWAANNLNRTGTYAALAAAGYVAAGKFKLRTKMTITKFQRVLPAGWNLLSQMGNPQVQWANNPPPPAAINNAADSQALARLLLDVDILRFITYGDRSPFLVNLLVGATPAPLAIVLLHAPGPQDATRTDAINIIGLSRPAGRAAATGNLLVMGDFNIAANQANATGRVYGRYTNAQHQFVFAQVTPAQTAQVFSPITGGPLNAPDLLPNIRTSLVNAYLADNSPLNATLANTFDKFFFRGAAAMNQANARAINLVDVMDPNSMHHDAGIAQSGLTFFRSLRGVAFLQGQEKRLQREFNKHNKSVITLTNQVGNIQTKINNTVPAPAPNSALVLRHTDAQNKLNTATQKRAAAQLQLTACQAMRALVGNAANLAPTGVGTALTTYRFAVSDHLPISVELTA